MFWHQCDNKIFNDENMQNIISNQFEMTIEKKPIKKYLNISSIPGNAKASTYILKNQKKKKSFLKIYT